MNEIQAIDLPDNWQGAQMLSFQWEFENSTATSLMLIKSRGRFRIFDADNLDQIYSSHLGNGYVSALQTDFEGDGDLELISLLRDRLTCYSVTSPLAVLKDRLDLIPTSLTLSEPYPNPFNAQVNLEYQVPDADRVTLRLYDLQGRQVAELVNARHTAGRYSVTYDAQGLVTGIYMIKLKGDSETTARKAVLMR